MAASSSAASSRSSSGAPLILQESLAEFHKLQSIYNKPEHRHSQQSTSTAAQSPPPPPPPYPGSPAQTKATVQIKIEPLDHQQGTLSAGPSFQASTGYALPSQQQQQQQPHPLQQQQSSSEEESRSRRSSGEEQAAAAPDDVQSKITPFLSLAMEQVKSEIASACATLGINPGEYLPECSMLNSASFLKHSYFGSYRHPAKKISNMIH